MTRAEDRIHRAARRIASALRDDGMQPSEPESDDTRIEYGGGDLFVVEIGGQPYTVSVTATYLTDEELEELSDE